MEYRYVSGGPYERGDEIRMYQERLNSIRTIYHGYWNHLQPDGIYGRKTRDAVKGFQIFVGVAPTSGHLTTATQSAIDSKYFECQRGYSVNTHSPIGYNPAMSYADQGYLDLVNYTVGPAPPKYNGDDPLGYTESGSAFPGTYATPSEKGFIGKHGGKITSCWNDIMSIIDAIMDGKMSVSQLKSYINTKRTTIQNKLTYFRDTVSKDFKNIKNVNMHRIREIFAVMDVEAERAIKKASTEIENAAKAGKVKAAVKKGGKVGWAMQFAMVVYHMGRCATATDAELKECQKDLKDALGGLLGAIIAFFIPKLIGMLSATIAGAVAGSAVPGIGTIVGAVVAFILSVVDIVLVFLTGKGLGDWIWEGIKSLDEWLGISAFLDKYIGESQFSDFRPGWDPIPGEI